MNINHRLYANGQLTNAGEDFAYDQQQQLEGLEEHQREAELARILDSLKRELGDNRAQVVMNAIKEFIDSIELFLGEAV